MAWEGPTEGARLTKPGLSEKQQVRYWERGEEEALHKCIWSNKLSLLRYNTWLIHLSLSMERKIFGCPWECCMVDIYQAYENEFVSLCMSTRNFDAAATMLRVRRLRF